jgi:hypothetical protein
MWLDTAGAVVKLPGLEDIVLQQDRQELIEIYERMCLDYERLTELVKKNSNSFEFNRARAYWLASIETGIKAEEYCGAGGSLKQFLIDNKILDEDGEVIEKEKIKCCKCGSDIETSSLLEEELEGCDFYCDSCWPDPEPCETCGKIECNGECCDCEYCVKRRG